MADRAFIDHLSEVWSSTAAVCRELTDDEWALPSDCPGWSVKDHVSHVIGTESMLLGRTAPAAAPAGLAHVLNPIAEMNEAWVEARRPRPGSDVLAELEQVTGLRLQALRAMTDDELEADTASPIGRVPYATFMDVRVMDCWVHEQDIRRAVGRPGDLEGEAADVALRRLISSLPYVVGKRAAAPDGTSVVLELTGPRPRRLAVAADGGRAREVETPVDPTVRITLDPETFVCLATGRCAGEEVLDEGRAVVAGDTDLGRRVVLNLSTMP